MNRILKRQTSRFHYGSKVPIVTINSIYYKIKDKRLQGKVTKTILEKNEFEKRLIETENELKTVNEMLNEKEANLNQLEVHVEVSKEKIKELKQEKHKLQKRLCRLKSRRCKCNLVERHEIEIKELKDKIDINNKRINELEQLNVGLEKDEIILFENGKYVNEVRDCIMSLATECNVSINKVNNVIKTVLHKLTGKLPERLPSMAVKSRLLIEAKAAAQQQIVEAMLKDSDPSKLIGNTLHSDATSKLFKHYQSFQITLPTGKSMSIAMSEVGSGDADSILQSFKLLITDLAETCTKHEIHRDAKVAKLITSITNTMSNQGSVNPVFNLALSEMRAELLPGLI